MNSRLQRVNEFRHYQKKLQARYGNNIEICDNISSWTIYISGTRTQPSKTLWTGKNLKEAL